jgi:hypothetical protein
MKINILENIYDYENKPLEISGKVITWREIAYQALNTMIEGETISPDEKMMAYGISLKIYSSNEPDLSIEEMSYIIGRIKKIYNPLICGRAVEYFNESKKERSE